MKNTNPKVDAYIVNAGQWRAAFETLRAILLGSPLAEDFKWKHPCYTFETSNVVIVQDFKDYCALLFVKGALMKDPEGVLVKLTENMQAERQIRFTSAEQVTAMETVINAYIAEAIEIEAAGLKFEYKKTEDFEVAEEFLVKLEEHPGLQEAFDALTPGRQRGYLLYFSSAKQSKTRAARVEKCIPDILEGKGLNDR